MRVGVVEEEGEAVAMKRVCVLIRALLSAKVTPRLGGPPQAGDLGKSSLEKQKCPSALPAAPGAHRTLTPAALQ